ncbi:protein FAM184B isoform X2 [Salvelinus fontinalis]|uniref:protein FAM184B isoform X2 n=1 Tax=Salvelinus fontinalis TaxID=8038 RepID=UPI002486002D|nr:protein FAM184B isoform X2 [Salvelinus fontinalis]
MMASGTGKAPQLPGPGSGSLNGTAADLPNIEQELYDYQMHGKMCKKIAQLTKVIYSLNTKNEEQEAALQTVSHARQEELRRVTTETCTEGEESVVLRTRLSELQETLAQVQADFENYRVQAEERDRGVEAELRRDYEEKLQALELERQEAQTQLNTAHDESLRLGRELETAGEAAQCLEVQCDELRRKGEEERGKGKEEETERMLLLSEEVKTLRKGKEQAEEERERAVREERERAVREEREEWERERAVREERERAVREEREKWERERAVREEREKWERERAVREEREKWERRMKEVTEEKEELKRSMEEACREERRQWEEREEVEKRGMSTVLRERVRKAEGEMEGSLQRLNESKRHAAKLQDRIQDLEEELESGRRRVSEAEGGAKRAWEELVVAKERLLLQEEELQSKSEELLSRGVCEGCVCVNVEELKGQVNKLQSRNRELELQSRNHDHARQIRQHAEALASLRSEMVRAQSEELRRERKHAEVEKKQMQKEMEEERDKLQKEREEERHRLQKEREEERDKLQKEREEERDRLQKEREEERERLQKEIEEVKGRVTTQMEGNTELVEEERESLNQEKKKLAEQAEVERKRLKDQAEEERKRLKDQVKRAIEEVMRKHAAELHNAQEALRRNQEVCVRVQEERRSSEEVCRRLETEREELRDQLQQATNQIWRLEGVIQQQSQGCVASETPPTCGIHCSHLREDLQHIQEEMERQRESYQREMTGLRTDKQRLEEKVLELNRQNQENTDTNVLEHSQENTDRNVLEHNQESTDRNVLEHNQENTDTNVLEHNQENTDERIRSECEERLRAELKAELDAAVATSNQREQELQTQLADLQSQVERKAGPADGHHDDSEIDRLRREVQETRDMNQRLREQLQEEPQRHSEERHVAALQVLERRAQEELQTERNRLQTLHLLQLDKQGTELSQQYTEWSRQLTQRHMKHIEDLQTELHTHTEMTALQQDLKQQNQYQVFERQLDESRCAVLELQRENTVLRDQLRSGEEAMGREREQKEREEEAQRLRVEVDRLREEEAQRLRVEVDRLREEVEKREEAQKQREEQREEEMREEEAQREMEEKRRDEEKRKEEENRREEMTRREEVEEKRKEEENRREEEEERREEMKRREEEVEEKRRKAEEEEKRRKEEEEEERREEMKREHRRAIQSLVCEYSSSQTELQTRIVALETELREREERCRRREVPLCDDLQMGRLQERLTERNQLIKRLVEERHQLQLHPPVAGDNGTLRLHDNRPHPGIVTPTMRRKRVEESPPRVSSIPNLSAYERSVLLPHDTPSPCLPQHPSSTLPYASCSLPRSSPSLPRTPRSPSLEPGGRGPLSRTPTPLPPAPTTPLPLCPSPLPEPRHGIRHVTSPSQELRPHLNSQPTRSPYLEQRGSDQGAEGRDPQRQEWYTKYFSF